MDPRILMCLKTLALIVSASIIVHLASPSPAPAADFDNYMEAAKYIVERVNEACNTGEPVKLSDGYWLVCRPGTAI